MTGLPARLKCGPPRISGKIPAISAGGPYGYGSPLDSGASAACADARLKPNRSVIVFVFRSEVRGILRISQGDFFVRLNETSSSERQ